MQSKDDAPQGALHGLTVIDLTRVLGGPYATQILADHGARVIKIEPPQGDETRDWGPPFHDFGNDDQAASYFVGVNRNKRAMALDLTRPEARELLLQMLEGADVLVDNFKPGSLKAWGLDYETVPNGRTSAYTSRANSTAWGVPQFGATSSGGIASGFVDCNDGWNLVHPGRPEWCNTTDHNCRNGAYVRWRGGSYVRWRGGVGRFGGRVHWSQLASLSCTAGPSSSA
jgi:hypothetical protein